MHKVEMSFVLLSKQEPHIWHVSYVYEMSQLQSVSQSVSYLGTCRHTFSLSRVCLTDCSKFNREM